MHKVKRTVQYRVLPVGGIRRASSPQGLTNVTQPNSCIRRRLKKTLWPQVNEPISAGTRRCVGIPSVCDGVNQSYGGR